MEDVVMLVNCQLYHKGLLKGPWVKKLNYQLYHKGLLKGTLSEEA